MAKFDTHRPDIGTIGLTDLPLFLAVARCGSFVDAARRTRTPPSTVSRAVARLEDELGVRLLTRTSRRVTLTQEGAILLERAGPLANELGEILDGVSDRRERPTGLLRVTAPVMTGARIGRALAAFAAKYPRVSIDLHLSNSVLDLVEQGFELAFRVGPLPESDLIARPLWPIPYSLGASRAFIERTLGGRRTVGLRELETLPAVLTRASWRFVGKNGAIEEVRPTARFRVNDPRLAVDAAVQGLGIAAAPDEVLATTDLVRLACELGELEPRRLYAVYPSRRLLSKRAQLAIEWVATR